MQNNYGQDPDFWMGAPMPSVAALNEIGQVQGQQSMFPVAGQGVRQPIRPKGRPQNLGTGSQEGWFSKMGGLEGLGSIGQGIGSAVQAYAALKGLGLAKDQLNFSKDAYQTNLRNTTKDYNTSLEDRAGARFAAENRGAGELEAYVAKNRL